MTRINAKTPKTKSMKPSSSNLDQFFISGIGTALQKELAEAGISDFRDQSLDEKTIFLKKVAKKYPKYATKFEKIFNAIQQKKNGKGSQKVSFPKDQYSEYHRKTKKATKKKKLLGKKNLGRK